MRWTLFLPALTFVAASGALATDPAAQPKAPSRTIPALTENALASTGTDPTAFVPIGWEIAATITGDLNSDGRPDAVLKLVPRGFKEGEEEFRELNDEYDCSICESPPWPIALLVLCAAERGFDRCGTNLGAVETNKSQFQIQLDRAVLQVGHGYASGRSSQSKTWKFRWDSRKRRFRLIGTEANEMVVDSASERSENWLTHEALTRDCEDNHETCSPWKKERLRGDRFLEDPLR